MPTASPVHARHRSTPLLSPSLQSLSSFPSFSPQTPRQFKISAPAPEKPPSFQNSQTPPPKTPRHFNISPHNFSRPHSPTHFAAAHPYFPFLRSFSANPPRFVIGHSFVIWPLSFVIL